MASVNGLTKERMLEIEANSVVNGVVDSAHHLILTRKDGTQIDAGDISAVAKLTIQDTTTLDLTLTGSGSLASPFLLKGDVKALAASMIASGTLDPARLPGMFASAVLDPTYRGPGPAKVRFLSGGALSTQAYQWIGQYQPWENRVVTMARVGTTWAILGHSSEEYFGGKIDLPFVNGWQSYNRRQAVSDNRWTNPRAQRLYSGIVMLSGLIYSGTLTNGTIIATLPVNYRPDTAMVFPINNSDTAKTIIIYPNGEIQVHGANWVAGYITLDGIAFPAAGVATWTDVGAAGSGTAFANGWTNYSNPIYGNARFWKDTFGFVWWAGLVAGGATADNTAMITVPNNLVGDFPTHSKAGSGNAFGFVSAITNPTPAMAWKNGTSSNTWVSLCGVAVASIDALTNPDNAWFTPTLAAGWSRYSAAFPAPQFLRRGDGMSVSRGLLKGGTAPAVKVANVPQEMLPGSEIILYSVSLALFNRVDIRAMDYSLDDDQGGYVAQTGSASWISWDNQMWMSGA